MGKYGLSAKLATQYIQEGRYVSPIEAWKAATHTVFISKSSQDKSCPRGTFLGLCEIGAIIGVPVGVYCKSIQNKQYAINALEILKMKSDIFYTEESLWKLVINSEVKVANHQMDVVLSLWNEGFINL